MKIYHLFSGHSLHIVPRIMNLFIAYQYETQTALEDHRFVVYSDTDDNERLQYKNAGAPAEQLIFLNHSLSGLSRFLWSLDSDSMLILHGVFDPGIWGALLTRPTFWKRIAWVMWGGDVYGLRAPKNRSLSLRFVYCEIRGMFLRPLKKIIIRRLGAIAALVPGDFDVLQAYCGKLDNYVRAFYSNFSLDPSTPTPADVKQPGEEVRVCLGNSATQSNRHIEALEWLGRYKSENMVVICPLTYGRPPEYRDTVVTAGKALLGENFRPLLDMLPKDEYSNLLKSADVLISNHNRQQGLFALYTMLFSGKKCFVRSDVSTYKMLRDFGIQVFPTEGIPAMSFTDFSRPLDIQTFQRNRELCQQNLSKKASLESWRQVFVRFREAD